MEKNTYHGRGVVLQIDGECCFTTATAWDDLFRFQDTFDHAQGIVNRSFDFIAHEIIGPANDDRGRRASLRSTNEDQLVVANAFLNDFLSTANH